MDLLVWIPVGFVLEALLVLFLAAVVAIATVILMAPPTLTLVVFVRKGIPG